jgi:hypothetical protein
VFHEVAGNYPHYFDPLNVASITKALILSLEQVRPKPSPQLRYEATAVQDDFVQTINRLILEGVTTSKGVH